MEDEKNKKDTAVWISHIKRCIAFHYIAGYEVICSSTQKEMWVIIQKYIDLGYWVQ